MDKEEWNDLERQVNDCFENIGGSTLKGPDRGKDIGNLMTHPFFINRDGSIPIHEGRKRGMLMQIMPKFDLGVVVGTPKFKTRVDADEALVALSRHGIGDWGELCKEDRDHNDEALVDGMRILSSYKTKAGIEFWIITESDRSVTTALLPEEYK